MNKEEAKLRLVEIQLGAFCDEYLTSDSEEPLATLFAACGLCEAFNLARGNPEVWAAGIAYAFCRMNFLLDGGSPCGLEISRDEFFSFFEGCNRSTVTQKATKIERELDFFHGHPLFSMPDVINGLPQFVELPNEMISIVPQKSLPVEICLMDEEESRQFEEELRVRELVAQEKKDKAADEQRKQRLAALEKKREKERKIQPELFDF